MKGDFSRSTFRATNHYSQVRAQQGRGVLDAELNEQADITGHVERTATTDIVGASGAPFHQATAFRNFQISVAPGGSDLLIAPGRFYVDGILCENDADPARLLAQPDLPGASLPTVAGSYAVYLDVWERHVTAADQRASGFPPIREVALGGADTASRVRVVWQVKLASVASKSCSAFTPPPRPTGKLRASEAQAAAAANDCLVPTSGGYRRLENQLYRVEVASVTGAQATYKWSRDNASSASRVTSSDQNAATIVVEDAGRDDVIGFAAANYVELSDESLALTGQAGRLFEVEAVSGTSIRVKNPTNASLALGTNPMLRRWDGIGNVTANAPAELEDGVQIEFDSGTFAVGDYWLIPARTLTGRVEWPRAGGGASVFEAPHGTAHHYAALAVVSFAGGVFDPAVTECRKLFPPLTAITARDVSYDPSQCSNLKGTSTVQQALDVLCQGTGGDNEDGIHVKGVVLSSGAALLNDAPIPPADLLKGLRIDCDEQLFDGSVVNKNGMPNPICTLTAEVPWPLRGEERQFWGVEGGTFVGYTPVTLAAEVTARENAITWMPLPPTQKWLSDRLLQMYTEMTNEPNPRVLVRLKLAGHFIWGPQRTAKLHLDGDVFGLPGDGRVDVGFPSGNGRRGGDLNMWFWLARQQRVAGVGFFTSRASRFFTSAAGAPAAGREAIQLGLDRTAAADLSSVLPAGYQLDTTQRFSPNDATALARRTGVARLTGMVTERFSRLGTVLTERLQNTLRVPITTEVVPEAQLPERLRALMANQAAPDFVIGEETLAAGLQRIEYGTDFIRL